MSIMQNDRDELLSVDERVLQKLPSMERRRKGPYALFECFQRIPCNPCYTACRSNAVKELTDINDLPETYYEKCIGCGLCVAHCSGLAAFVIDETFSETRTLIRLPYEYLPLPEKGQLVDAVNRSGQVVTTAVVEEILSFEDHTSIVGISVEDRYAHVVRGIALELTRQNGHFEPEPAEVEEDEAIVCRCEDIDQETLKMLLEQGHTTLNDLKLEARFMMGSCQGKTCTAILVRELSAKTGQEVDRIKGPRYRPPMRPVTVGSIAGYAQE